MLTKAIFTGSVLALLSGSIVYFGTEGADALSTGITKDKLVQDTELAGAPASATARETQVVKTAEAEPAATPTKDKMRSKDMSADKAEAKPADVGTKSEEMKTAFNAASHPHDDKAKTKTSTKAKAKTEAESEPKTKWLDQYLKKTQPKKASENMSDSMTKDKTSAKMMSEEEKSSATTYETGTDATEGRDGKEKMSRESKSKQEKSSATTYETGSDAVEGMSIDGPAEALDSKMSKTPSSAKKYQDKSDRAEMDDKKSDRRKPGSSVTAYRDKAMRAEMDEKKSEDMKTASSAKTFGDKSDSAKPGMKKSGSAEPASSAKTYRDKSMRAEMDEKNAEETSKEIKGKVIIKMNGDDALAWTSEDGSFDLERIEEIMREHKGAEKEIRIMRMDMTTDKKKKSERKARNTLDYDMVLEEAGKLQVLDMRNIAYFEIIDYAIDRRNFGRAADVLDNLSDPELRDTARAKIGVGLARSGNSDAAFAVLDEMEIPELTASIRLEIITALVATRAERASSDTRR